MKNTLSVLLFILFVFGINQTDAAAQQKRFPTAVLQPALWERMETSAPSECTDSPQKCAAGFLSAAGFDTDRSAKFSVYPLGERDGRNLTIVFVTLKVTDDDSISGVRYRLAMSLGDVEDRSYKLETLGRQVTCFRGHKNWSKAPCR